MNDTCTCADYSLFFPDDLQKEMIIPRPRVPSPEAENDEDNDFSNLSKEEIERLSRERYADLKVICRRPFIVYLRS